MLAFQHPLRILTPPMKIEIEWTSSYQALLTHQGSQFQLDLLPKMKLTPLPPEPRDLEHHHSFASVLMGRLAPLILGAMQAQCVSDEALDPSGDTDNTFRPLPEYTAREVLRKLDQFTD